MNRLFAQKITKRLFALPMRNARSRPSLGQVRFFAPVCGPPKDPLSKKDLWVYGGGFIFAIMIIPTWGLFSVPAWVRVHQGAGRDHDADD